MASVSGPLCYVNGQRVESTNSNAEDDVDVLEPATGCAYITATYCRCLNFVVSK